MLAIPWVARADLRVVPNAAPTANRAYDHTGPTVDPPTSGGMLGAASAFARNLTNDFKTQVGFPVRFVTAHPIGTTVGVAGILALIATDPSTRDWLASPSFVEDNGLVEPAIRMSDIPTVRNTVLLVGGVGAFGWFAHSQRELTTSSMLAEAIITSSVWTGAIKLMTGRQRPRESTEYVPDWTGPGSMFSDDGHGVFMSFPSGHASSSWAVATVLAHQYPTHGVVPVLAYAGATAMCYSRMVIGAHWLADVTVGALIGWGSARQVIGAHDERAGAASPTAWHLGVDIHDGYRGLAFSRGL
jgi:membrane-associated phospholipid phosphatase